MMVAGWTVKMKMKVMIVLFLNKHHQLFNRWHRWWLSSLQLIEYVEMKWNESEIISYAIEIFNLNEERRTHIWSWKCTFLAHILDLELPLAGNHPRKKCFFLRNIKKGINFLFYLLVFVGTGDLRFLNGEKKYVTTFDVHQSWRFWDGIRWTPLTHCCIPNSIHNRHPQQFQLFLIKLRAFGWVNGIANDLASLILDIERRQSPDGTFNDFQIDTEHENIDRIRSNLICGISSNCDSLE